MQTSGQIIIMEVYVYYKKVTMCKDYKACSIGTIRILHGTHFLENTKGLAREARSLLQQAKTGNLSAASISFF